MRKTLSGAIALAVLTCSISAPAPAQKNNKSGPTPDETAVHDYILTVEKAQRYQEVATKFEEAGEKDADLKAELEKVSATNVYNVEKIALLEKSPHAAAWFKRMNYPIRDFVLLPLTAMSAGLAATLPENGRAKLPYVNPVNIQFCKDHKADLKKWGLTEE